MVASLIEFNFPSHGYATGNRHRMIVPFPRIDAFEMNFKIRIFNIWNSTEGDIREARTLQIFKESLFAYLTSKFKFYSGLYNVLPES